MRDLAKSQSRLPMSAPPHQPRARSSGPRCRHCLPHPPAPAATAGRPFGSARRLHPRDVAVAERFLDRYVFRCTHPPRPSNLRCAAQLLPSETPKPAQGRHHQTLPHGRAASSVCRSARPGPLAAASILGVEREYKGLYGGGWPLRGMGAAGTALGAADARMNEYYEIGTILTQKSQGVRRPRKHKTNF